MNANVERAPSGRRGGPCSVAGCTDPTIGRGYCRAHWLRWRRHGDPLAGGPRRRRQVGVECSAPGCDRPAKGRNLCSSHHARSLRSVDADLSGPIVSRVAPVDVRFWRKVNKSGPTPVRRPELGPCWVWTPTPRGCQGYARINVGGDTGTVRAHVWSWQQENGPVPDGLELDHLCSVRHCVRPSHLEAVTHQENVARGEAGEHMRAAGCPGEPMPEPTR